MTPWWRRLWWRLWAGRACVLCGGYIWRNDHHFHHRDCSHARMAEIAERNGVKPGPCAWCDPVGFAAFRQ